VAVGFEEGLRPVRDVQGLFLLGEVVPGVYSAVKSVPPWPASRTTSPLQERFYALTSAVEAVMEIRIAASIAASTVAHALKRSAYVISHPSQAPPRVR